MDITDTIITTVLISGTIIWLTIGFLVKDSNASMFFMLTVFMWPFLVIASLVMLPFFGVALGVSMLVKKVFRLG